MKISYIKKNTFRELVRTDLRINLILIKWVLAKLTGSTNLYLSVVKGIKKMDHVNFDREIGTKTVLTGKIIPSREA